MKKKKTGKKKRPRGQVIVAPNGPRGRHGWTVKAGVLMAATFPTQAKAIDHAVKYCKSMLRQTGWLSELTIKGRNGRVRDKRTYGEDPERTKG